MPSFITIIGNGRQWVYTLGRATQGESLANLVLTLKNPARSPCDVGVPEVLILSANNRKAEEDESPERTHVTC